MKKKREKEFGLPALNTAQLGQLWKKKKRYKEPYGPTRNDY